MVVFLDPHGDDVALFAAFSLMTPRDEYVLPVVVFDSFAQSNRGYHQCDAVTRQRETELAYRELGGGNFLMYLPVYCGLRDDVDYVPENKVSDIDRAIVQAIAIRRDRSTVEVDSDPITDIYAPLWEHHGHVQHNLVANAAYIIAPGARVHRYLTYTRTDGRSRNGNITTPQPEWIARKHHALACFTSQMQECTGCQEWFTGDLKEYLA